MQKKEVNPLHIFILVAAYIADIVLLATTKAPSGFNLGYFLMCVVVAVPPIVLLILLIGKLHGKLKERFIQPDDEKAKAKSRAILAGLIAVCMLVVIGGFALYKEITSGGPMKRADQLVEQGEYAEAIRLYKDLKINRGMECDDRIGNAYALQAKAMVESGDIAGANALLRKEMYCWKELRRQAADLLRSNQELYQLYFTPGDTSIPIGRYGVDRSDQYSAHWYIMEEKDGNVLLLNAYLEAGWIQPQMGVYSSNEEKATKGWEDSLLRKNLNEGENSLYQKMFTDAERAAILLSTIENTVHENNEVVRGNDTQDYIFLLSKDEVMTYLNTLSPEKMENDGWRRYGEWWTRTVAGLNEVRANYGSGYEHCSGFMLAMSRPPYNRILHAEKVDYINKVETFKHMIQPAMWVNIDLLLKSWQE